MKDTSSAALSRRFWAYLRPYKRSIAIAGLGNVMTVTIAMLTPLIVKFVIDEAIPGRNTALLIGAVSVFMTLAFLRFVTAYGHLSQ